MYVYDCVYRTATQAHTHSSTRHPPNGARSVAPSPYTRGGPRQRDTHCDDSRAGLPALHAGCECGVAEVEDGPDAPFHLLAPTAMPTGQGQRCTGQRNRRRRVPRCADSIGTSQRTEPPRPVQLTVPLTLGQAGCCTDALSSVYTFPPGLPVTLPSNHSLVRSEEQCTGMVVNITHTLIPASGARWLPETARERDRRDPSTGHPIPIPTLTPNKHTLSLTEAITGEGTWLGSTVSEGCRRNFPFQCFLFVIFRAASEVLCCLRAVSGPDTAATPRATLAQRKSCTGFRPCFSPFCLEISHLGPGVAYYTRIVYRLGVRYTFRVFRHPFWGCVACVVSADSRTTPSGLVSSF